MNRTIELVHAGQWTASQVVRLVRALVCPTCEVVDVERTRPGDGCATGASEPSVRLDGRIIWLDKAASGTPPRAPDVPVTKRGATREAQER